MLVGEEAAVVEAVLEAALDAVEEIDEELIVADEVTALWAAGASLELEVDEDTVLEIAADDPALEIASDDTTLDDEADEGWDTEATVCSVVAEIGAEIAAAAP